MNGQQSFFDALDTPNECAEEKNKEPKDDADDCGITDDAPFVAVESKKEEPKVSPLYERYMAIQNEHPDSIVAVRVGDFYEIFGENAKILSRELDLTLTGRDCGLSERLPMIGFPYHKADTYFGKIRQTHRLVVAENNSETVLEMYVPVSNVLVDGATGEVVRQEETEPDLMALIARSFDEAYISDLYERLEYHIDIC